MNGTAYIIPACWRSLLGALAQLANALGVSGVDSVSDRFGRCTSFFFAGLISVGGFAVLYTASLPVNFLAGKMIDACALGMAIVNGTNVYL